MVGAAMRAALTAAAMLLVASAARSAPFDFVPAPQTDLNRVYRVDRASGEVTACQYGLQEGGLGLTLCFGAGEGAGAQPPGDYTATASRHEREGGVFRINQRTGEMSVCYVYDEKVVCTPPAGPPPASRTGQPRP